jgi:uncharacterized protein HemX
MMAAVLTAVGLVADASQPGWGDLAVLGTYALAMIVGAGGVYRFQVLHERRQTEQERERTETERVERKEAEARERKLAEVVLPALQEANRAMDLWGRMVERGQTRT